MRSEWSACREVQVSPRSATEYEQKECLKTFCGQGLMFAFSAASFMIICKPGLGGGIAPFGFAYGFKIWKRFSAISMSLRFRFLDLEKGKSINFRSNLTSDQSSCSTSDRRNPVKAETAKKGTNSGRKALRKR